MNILPLFSLSVAFCNFPKLLLRDTTGGTERTHDALAHVGGFIDAVFYCPHGPKSTCRCRKPKPGMLLEIAQRLNHSLKNVPCVGDAVRDLQAAMAAQASPVLVRTGKGQHTLDKGLPKSLHDENIPVYKDLAEFASAWIGSHV